MSNKFRNNFTFKYLLYENGPFYQQMGVVILDCKFHFHHKMIFKFLFDSFSAVFFQKSY